MALDQRLKQNADDYAIDIIECFLTNKIDCIKIQGAIIASVVPKLSETINLAIRKFLNEDAEILKLAIKVKLNLEIKLNNKMKLAMIV